MIITCDGNIPSRWAHTFNIAHMAEGFLENGQDVELVTFFSIPNLIKRIKVGGVHGYYGMSDGIKVTFIHALNGRFLFDTVGDEPYNRKAADYIKAKDPDFVYARSFLTAYFCVKKGIPTILETHTTMYDHPGLGRVYSIADDPCFKGLVTISDDIKKEHVKRGIPEGKIVVAEDGVDLKRFDINDDRRYWRGRLSLPLDEKIVVYCGQLYDEKGIEHILQTAKRLKYKGITFILVGGFSKDINRWKHYCKRQGITNVVFTGFVRNPKVPQYLKAADVLIMPYRTDIDYEILDVNTTSPLKLFEYMAANRPIVSTNIPTISKVLVHGESALLAEPNDVRQLEAYVEKLLEEPNIAKELSGRAFEDVKQYQWRNRCEKIMRGCLDVRDNRAGE